MLTLYFMLAIHIIPCGCLRICVATSFQAASSAARSLQGDFSSRIDQVSAALKKLRVHVEAAIDFPEEEIDFLADGQVQGQLDAIRTQLDAVLVAATSVAPEHEPLEDRLATHDPDTQKSADRQKGEAGEDPGASPSTQAPTPCRARHACGQFPDRNRRSPV